MAEVEGRGQDVLGLLVQAGEDLGVRARDPRRASRAGRRASGSSPIAASSSRTAASPRSWSNAAASAASRRRRSTRRRPRAASRSVSRRTAGGVRRASGRRDGRRPARSRTVGDRCPASATGGDRLAVGRRRRGRAGPRGTRRTLDDTAAKISASCSLSSVSFSRSSSTRSSSTSRFSTRIVEGLVVRVVDEARAPRRRSTAGDVLGVVALVAHVAAEEDLAVGLAELDRAEPLVHAELRDHRAGDRGRLLDVVARTGRRVVEDQLLGDAATQRVRERGRASRCGWSSTCPRPAGPSCSRARDRAAGSSPCAPGRCSAARARPGRDRPRGTR